MIKTKFLCWVLVLVTVLFTFQSFPTHVAAAAAVEEVEIDVNGETKTKITESSGAEAAANTKCKDDDETAGACISSSEKEQDASNGNVGGEDAIFADIFSDPEEKDGRGKLSPWDEIGATISNLAKNILPSSNGDDKVAGQQQQQQNMVSLDVILQKAREIQKAASPYNPERNFLEMLEHFKTHFEESSKMVKEAFSHVDFNRLSLFALWYYVEKEESIKTPSWKRRK